MKKVTAFFLIISILLSIGGYASAEMDITMVFDLNSACFSTEGEVISSGLKGYQNSETIYFNAAGAAIWRPEFEIGGVYRVSVWNVANSGNVEQVKVQIQDKSGFQEAFYQHRDAETGFVELGQYEFSAGSSGEVKILAVPGGYTRVNSVKFELVEITETKENMVPIEEDVPYEGYAQRPLQERNVALPEIHPEAQKFYVSPGSNGDGSEQNPFGSIAQAQQKVRQVIQNGYPEYGIGIYLKDGTYILDETLAFTAKDSGTKEYPVIWQTYQGEEVSITAGKLIENSAMEKVTEKAILQKLPEKGKNQVYQVDLKKCGIDRVAPMDLRQSLPYMLTIGDRGGVLARWPNEGFSFTGNVIDSSSRNDSGPRKKGFTYEITNPRMLRWKDAQDVWLNGYWLTPYTIDYAKVASLDTDHMKISGKEYNDLGAYGNARYFAQNLLEELDHQGEWYVDCASNTLYLYPFPGWETQEILFAPSNFDLVEFQDASYIMLRGITLETGGANGITFSDDSKGCGLIGQEIRNVSGMGAHIKGTDNFVRDCDISYTGAQGIGLDGGKEYELIHGRNYAENNRIHDVGSGGGKKQGITIDGCGNRVSNNHIYNIPTHGICGTGMMQTIEYNIIERTNLEMGDTAGIYFINSGMGYGTKIQYNLVRDSVGVLPSSAVMFSGSMGIYLDSASSGIDVIGNIVMNVPERGLFSNVGRENRFINNLLINCGYSISIPKSAGANAIGGSWYNIKKYPITEEPLKSLYPHLATIEEEVNDVNEYTQTKYCVIKNNAMFQSGNSDFGNVAELGGTVENNVHFDGVPKGDLNTLLDLDYEQIREQIPDFQDIPVEKMGIYTGGERKDGTTVVFDNRVPEFQLLFPDNGAKNVDAKAGFQWQVGNGGILKSVIYVAEDPAFQKLVMFGEYENGACASNLEYGKTYYWRVQEIPMQGYEPRWNQGGVFSFSTIPAADKLKGEIAAAKALLEKTSGMVERFSHQDLQLLEQAVSEAEGALDGGDVQSQNLAIRSLTDAMDQSRSHMTADRGNMATLIFDGFEGDSIGQRPLGLFIRANVPLAISTQRDRQNENNHVVEFYDTHRTPHYANRYFKSQEKYVVAGTSVMTKQKNGAFSVSLMQTGKYPLESGLTDYDAAKVVFGTDGMIYGDSQKQVPLMPYEENQWYAIKIMLDLSLGTYDVAINGKVMAEEIPQCNPKVKSVNQIRFDTTMGDSDTRATKGTYWIDNMVVQAPYSQGNNPYLMKLSIDGASLEGFEPGKTYYQTGLSVDELSNAVLQYEVGKNAVVSDTMAGDLRIICVLSADFTGATTYLLKAE